MYKKFLIAIFGIILITPANSQAAVIYVPDTYKTIGEAVKNAFPKDAIIVDDGDYTENIIITKPLTITSKKGADFSSVHAMNHNEPVFKISNADEAAIIGFTITNSETAGIYLSHSRHGQILDNKILDNKNGILVYASDNNVLANNSVNSNEQYGIYLEASHGNILEKNTVNSNKDKGIFLSASHNNNLLDNNVSLNAWDGIILWSSRNNILKDNNVFRNRYAIVLNDSDNNTLINNSTWPNIYIILPVVLIYLGGIFYLIQKFVFRFLLRDRYV